MTIAIISLVTLVLGFVARIVYRNWDKSDNLTPQQRNEKELQKIETNFAKSDSQAISVDINDRLERLRNLQNSGQPDTNNSPKTR